jgi:hypothetical protein
MSVKVATLIRAKADLPRAKFTSYTYVLAAAQCSQVASEHAANPVGVTWVRKSPCSTTETRSAARTHHVAHSVMTVAASN